MTSEEQFEAASHGVVLFRLEQNRVYRAGGSEAERYLHGRLTQDIKKLNVGQGTRSLVLSPQGKIQGQMLVLRGPNDFLIISDPLPLEIDTDSFAAAILQFRVSDDIQLKKTDLALFSLQGPKSQKVLETFDLKLPVKPLEQVDVTIAQAAVTVVFNPRGADLGFDLLVDQKQRDMVASAVLAAGKDEGIVVGSAEARDMLRFSSGLLEYGSELSEKLSAPEIDLAGLVSPNKGCYVGQEVVEMAQARGRAPRTVVLLSAVSAEPFSADQQISTKPENDEAGTSDKIDCGKILSACLFPSKNQSLLFCLLKSSLPKDSPLFVGSTALHRI